MEGFSDIRAWTVVGVVGIVLLLLLLLRAATKWVRKRQAPNAPKSTAQKQRQRHWFDIFSLVAGTLILIGSFISSTFSKDKPPPTWVIWVGVAVVLIGAVQLVQGYFQKRADANHSVELWMQKVRALVEEWPLPRVLEVDPYKHLGVTPSDLANHYVPKGERPPYVARDIDAALDTALISSNLVLLVGHSKSGKSRTAYEAALRCHPQQRLIIPSEGKALAELFRLEPPLEWDSDFVIVWLDDLQRFLGPNGLTPSLLNGLLQHKGQMKVLATLTTKRHDDYLSSTSDIDKDSQHILRRFHEIRLDSALSPKETQRAKTLYRNEPEEKLAGGLGEHLIAAHELTRKYERGKEIHAQGHALVLAAIDWRRAGMLRPIPETVLHTLAGQYLDLLKLPHVDLSHPLILDQKLPGKRVVRTAIQRIEPSRAGACLPASCEWLGSIRNLV